MAWFIEWWGNIGLLGQIMACAAIPMTLIMLLQFLLMLIGAGFGGESDGGADSGEIEFDADSDVDFDADAEADFDSALEIDDGSDMGENTQEQAQHHDSLRILTVRGIVAFFAIGGWAGLAALSAGINSIWAIQISLLAGVAAMLLASLVIKFALKMQSSGNIDLKNAVSQTADVYITIPPQRKNTGRVTMLLQERFIEIEAVTDSETPLKPNTKVEIVGLAGKDCLVVREKGEG